MEEIDNFTKENPGKLENTDYCSILKANINELAKKHCKGIKRQYDIKLNEHITKKTELKQARRK